MPDLITVPAGLDLALFGASNECGYLLIDRVSLIAQFAEFLGVHHFFFLVSRWL